MIVSSDAKMKRPISGVDPSEMEIVRSISNWVQFAPGKTIFTRDDPTDFFYILDTGCVRVFYNSWNGNDVTFFNCWPGGFFGIAEAISLRPRAASAQAMLPSAAWAINCKLFPTIAALAPKLVMRLAEEMGYRLHSIALSMTSVVTIPLRVRVARQLLATNEERNESLAMPLNEGFTHESMANLVGCSRQTLTKVLNEFARAGFIKIERKRIVILDGKGLSRHAGLLTLKT